MPYSFYAYPSQPKAIGDVIRQALEYIKTDLRNNDHHGWEESNIVGQFLSKGILEQIDECESLGADITFLNFNVVYEIGYAIGKGKKIVLARNTSITGDESILREVGLFDTIGYATYTDSRKLANIMVSAQDKSPINVSGNINKSAPVYVVLPRERTNSEFHLLSRIKKTKLRFRSYDPLENPRMSPFDAINNTVNSYGIIIPLIPQIRTDARVHNIRAAFVAGLAKGLEKEVLILQFGDDPVPLDYRDFVCFADTNSKIDDHLSDFAPAIMQLLQSGDPEGESKPTSLLARMHLGAASAENEIHDLAEYYLETDQFRRACRGEVQIVTGRKGSGKTALFFRLRDKARAYRTNIVLDLRPEGYQLQKFKDVVLAYLELGTKEHTITAFWEYLLLLELCHKILEQDRQLHLSHSKLYEPYQELAKLYKSDEYVSEGDFAERMLKLTERILADFQGVLGNNKNGQMRLSSQELTDLLYKHDAKTLRTQIKNYLVHKRDVWILFDNLDKGWPPKGLDEYDILILKCLIEATRKLERYFRRESERCTSVLFLRNDVFEMLVDNSADRGKIGRVNIDWTDAELIREMLRLRLAVNNDDTTVPFDKLWGKIAVSHIGVEESSTYLIDRSLMRPRFLIDLTNHCRSHAVNLGKTKIDYSDFIEGEKAYSNELVESVCLEMRDVFPELQPDIKDLLYSFIGISAHQSQEEIYAIFKNYGIAESDFSKIIELLMWWGFLGVVKEDRSIEYIFTLHYNMNHLKASSRKATPPVYVINPAFWHGLDIKHTDG